MGIVVLISGGRDYQNRKLVFTVLDYINDKSGIDYLISGGAKGADTLGIEWAKLRGVPLIVKMADWDRFGKSAGYIRNKEMAECDPDICVAFAGGRGTDNMIKLCKEFGIRFKRYEHNE